ncbi:hypothetical protein OG21DRAFT_1558642 [Imleria badia]|nr:hypothetical protein OG21DRAFT_1558642 [Imleria badia]
MTSCTVTARKYFTRWKLVLSTSLPNIEVHPENILEIQDDEVSSKGWKGRKAPEGKVLTDGCGLIDGAALTQIMRIMKYSTALGLLLYKVVLEDPKGYGSFTMTLMSRLQMDLPKSELGAPRPISMLWMELKVTLQPYVWFSVILWMVTFGGVRKKMETLIIISLATIVYIFQAAEERHSHIELEWCPELQLLWRLEIYPQIVIPRIYIYLIGKFNWDRGVRNYPVGWDWFLRQRQGRARGYGRQGVRLEGNNWKLV